MSFLYPLFLAGISAIALPIILHMIRRHTRNRIKFSSLMFLRTTLPRFKNRSKLENIPLLLLRCLIICLLAFAFARPFFSVPSDYEDPNLGRRIAILLDTSASMRRADLWNQAVGQVREVLNDLRQNDRISVMSFDQSTQILIDFDEWETLEPDQRATIVLEHISQVSPGFSQTNLGMALVTAAEAIEDDEVNQEKPATGSRQIILISDMQQGSDLEELRTYDWPVNMKLEIKQLKCNDTTNASIQLVANFSNPGGSAEQAQPGIRVINETESTKEQYKISLAGSAENPMNVYVPPGHNVVVRAPAYVTAAGTYRLVLDGDDFDFDNELYLAPFEKQQVNIIYIGPDNPTYTRNLLYFVRQVYSATGIFKANIIAHKGNDIIPDLEIQTAHLIIASDNISRNNQPAIKRYLESGRTLLLIMESTDVTETISDFADIENLSAEQITPEMYAMLGRIEFDHPLLQPFSDPRFGDFTKIHFWQYRRINIADIPGAQVLAWYDNDDPALFEILIGKGSLLVLTSSWGPSHSDLALSSKFAPLLYSILEYGGTLAGQQSQYFVGEPITLPNWAKSESANAKIRKPDDSVVDLAAGQEIFTQTDEPGFYTINSAENTMTVAVNLPVKEYRTEPLSTEDIENAGISLESAGNVVNEQSEKVKKRISLAQMEYKQKFWRWVILVILVAIIFEIWLGGWLTRPTVFEGQEK